MALTASISRNCCSTKYVAMLVMSNQNEEIAQLLRPVVFTQLKGTRAVSSLSVKARKHDERSLQSDFPSSYTEKARERANQLPGSRNANEKSRVLVNNNKTENNLDESSSSSSTTTITVAAHPAHHYISGGMPCDPAPPQFRLAEYGEGSLHSLILLRHGESEWNSENRYTGW